MIVFKVDTTYGKDQEKMTLWSDGKTNEEIQNLAESDSSSVAYNLHEDLLCVKEDLAKANKRIARLQLNVKEFKEFIDVARNMFLDLDEMEVNSKEYTDLLSDLFTLFCGGDEFHKYVNKFAIEKKIEVLDKLSAPLTYNRQYPEFCMKTRIDEEIEQLRKEQEK